MIQLAKDRLKIAILQNGAIGQIVDRDIMVNQVKGNTLDGSLSNIYLRLRDDDGSWKYQPLLGPNAQSTVKYNANTAIWQGTFHQIHYAVKLLLGNDQWFWQVKLESDCEQFADLTYVQDLGLGEEGFVTSNEAYASQYLDHFVNHADGFIDVATRQNQSQNGNYPYLQEGSLDKLSSFSTDGIQFFGSNYRQSNEPIAMVNDNLDNINYQYELALTALRTQPLRVNPKSTETIFYAAFKNNRPSENISLLVAKDELKRAYQAACQQAEVPTNILSATKRFLKLGSPISGRKLTQKECEQLFPIQRQVEKVSGEMASFFTQNNAHVVFPSKEIRQQRQTGNIILAGQTITPGTPLLAATQFMSGIFQSHVVFGNTNMNILETNVRDPYNLFKVTGTRIYIKIDDEYRILGLPSAYAMTYNGADWYYQLADDLLIISSDADSQQQQINLRLHSVKSKHYDFLVTMQLDLSTLGKQPRMNTQDAILTIEPADNTLMAKRIKTLGYKINYQCFQGQALNLGNETMIFGNSPYEATNQIVASYRSTSDFEIITGLKKDTVSPFNVAAARESHFTYTEQLLNHFRLETKNSIKTDKVDQTNIIMRWFTHDALVHLLSPHGLEQYGGAAWGTRDLSQGPTEFFLSTGHYAQVRQIILMLYKHQFIENGNWPQWFMFDEYQDQFANESHGDVIVWPLKVVADYLLATNDQSILDEKLSYMSLKDKRSTLEETTLAQHILKQIDYIKKHFLFGTFVSAYGDGDWDDTLQPADPKQKKVMASTWTEELTIETMRKCQQAFIDNSNLAKITAELAEKMKLDFDHYFKRDQVLPGFIRMNEQHEVVPLIHPNDEITGIDYRLLPLSQGVLSKILTGDEATKALALIKNHLLFPDGVRLMNRPSTYHGGTSTIFKRAEQAANFGREIGLLYVHAHIRYAEAVAVNGNPNTAWDLLQLVNPIRLKDRVKNAALRQSNTYFSSSDADFFDRYQAQSEFDRVRKQQVAVKGGWRLYSSGPGIYIGSLLNDVFDVSSRQTFNQEANQLVCRFDKDINILENTDNKRFALK